MIEIEKQLLDPNISKQTKRYIIANYIKDICDVHVEPIIGRYSKFPALEINNVISLLKYADLIDPDSKYNFTLMIDRGFGDDSPKLELCWEIVV